MLKFARAISFFLGPVFILLPIPFILVTKVSQDYSYALKWTMFSYVFILAVALFVIVGVMLGIFSNFDVSKREQRPLLFSFSAFAAFCYLLSLIILNGPKVLFVGFFALILGLIGVIIINRWIKVSIHLAAATATLLFVGAVYKGYFFLLLFLIPLLAWARVKMKEHTPMETIIGSILGIVITLTAYLVSRQFLLGIIYN
jgi:membrane-associated phospholipid phosphatase